ncbi:MAG: METTL5 family protein [Candidatus Thermoplasmatota archaeon]|jgi:putative methylase|nr:METTL5 family protein [Candidatus Thermoplasmatota archaeon]
MKKKQLEIILQKIPTFTKPIVELEQYQTPAEIAADIIFIAYQLGDIKDKTVIDLGCGTGIFSIGAKIMGAKKVIGVDIEKNCLKIARKYAREKKLKITFINKDVKDIKTKCDTVLMNPPFGAQNSNKKADRRFIEKGFEIACVIYSLHLSKTVAFIEKMVKSLNGEINLEKQYIFPLKNIYDFHEKKVLNYNICLLRILTKK